MAVAVGVCSAVFWLIYALLLRPLPIPRPGELVALYPVLNKRTLPLQYSDFTDLKAAGQAMPLEAFRFEAATVGDGTETSEVWVDLVSGGYFEMLGVRALQGRLLDRTDERERLHVVVVAEEFWRARLGADTAIIGKRLRIGDLAATVVGIAPQRFAGVHFARRQSLAMPLSVPIYAGVAPEEETVTLLARRTPDGPWLASLDVAVRRCCLDSVRVAARSIERPLPKAWPGDIPPDVHRDFPDADARPHLRVEDASRGLTWNQDLRGRWDSQLFLVAAGGVVLLLTASANVSALALSRAQARQREFAVRRALGAGWQDIFVLVLAEAIMLACVGGVLATLTNPWATRLMVTLLPAGTRGWEGALAWRPSLVALAVTVLIVIASSLLISVVPAIAAIRSELADRPGRRRIGREVGGNILIGAQTALGVVLVSLSALFVRTLNELTRDEGGYRTRQVVFTRIVGASHARDLAAMNAHYERMRLEAASLPGADGAALAWSLPVTGGAHTELPVRPPGSSTRDPLLVSGNFVSPTFFAVSGIGIAAGREFDARDTEASEPVVIVSEALARRLGTVRLGATVDLSSRAFRVIGIARNAKYPGLASSQSLRNGENEVVYVSLAQGRLAGRYLFDRVTLVVRAQSNPATLAPVLLRRVKEVAPENRFASVATVENLLRNRTTSERLLASLLGLFAGASIALLAVGVFGTVSRAVALRTREIGIRIAIGASPGRTVWFVLKRVAIVAIAASSAGTALAFGSARSIESQFFGVSASDPLVLGVAALALILVSLAAGLFPSLRAASVQPVVALRAE